MAKKVNPELLKLDKRILSRRLLSGEITEKDLQTLLKKIPDVAENAEEVSVDENEK